MVALRPKLRVTSQVHEAEVVGGTTSDLKEHGGELAKGEKVWRLD